jgi:hypothetical protein
MFRILQLLFFLSLFLVIVKASEHKYPQGWDELQNNEGWELVKKTDRVQILIKQLNVSPLPAFRAELISNVDSDRLADVAWLVEKSSDIFPNAYIIDAGVYYKRSDTSYTAFQEFDIPFLASRLYQFNSIRLGNIIHWTRTDTVNLSFNPDELLLPPVNFGSWEIQSLGNQSKIIYRVCTDPGGDIPLWIVEQANQRYLPLMLLDIETYSKEKIVPR